ncbi:FRAS1-related extracellular matrix protein 1-like [Diadema antillarum]|uniref:FRAS1-related extracellular matrix protein 1-like n=1 Tax=Diadema antillarum TaxID=105358 RepID=UPI003A88740F
MARITDRELITSLLLLGHMAAVIGQLVTVNQGLEVAIGRHVYLNRSVLAFEPVTEGQQCKVEVALNEAYFQRVGILQPEVFDCDYPPETVTYTHSGIPLLDQDTIKLRVYKFTETDTVHETVYVTVNITQDPYHVVRPVQALPVERFFGTSDLIDRTVVDFDYERWRNVSCTVQINTVTSGFPKYGELTRGYGSEKEQVQALTADCHEFMMGMVRYEHLVPPTPNIDFIPMTLIINDPMMIDGMFEERYYLPVDLQEAFPNQNPVGSMMSMYVMEADQFILTTITPSVISGSDDETENEDLIFYISQPFGPDEGYIVNLDDHTHPIESFTQYDLSRLNIAYKPPTVSSPERRVFTVEFTVYDAYFAPSNPINLLVSVRSTETNAPRVSVNTGLTMLEGQSRTIRPTNFQLVDNDNLIFVRAKVVGGLRHGRLYVNGRPAIMFSAANINANSVVYEHDDSDTLRDSIELRITDGRHSIRTTIPINILPKDDSPPYLINNIQFELKEGRSVRIHRMMLMASDLDSSDDYIVFRITQPPHAGELLKKFSEDTYGYPVSEFTQRDLFRGLIYYHHLGQEIFDDSFEFILLDNQIPPNESPTQVVMIKVAPVHDLPPTRVPGSSQSLVVRETDIGYITRDHLHFTDAESSEERLRFTITTPPYSVESFSLTNAGRVFSTAGMVSPSKHPSNQALRSFTQGEINQRTIAYMPPMKEIGPNSRRIGFVFSVTDPYGNIVLGEFFNITILPVNNQEPVIYFSDLLVKEGRSLTFDTIQFSVSDMDTNAEELVVSIVQLPLRGQVFLGGVNMTVGNHFTMADVAAGRVSYVSDGSEATADEFVISVSDGVHTVTETVHLTIVPVNDEIPALLTGLESELTIPEGGSVTIGADILSATDPDTNDMLLHYIVVMHPLRGVLLRDGVIVNRFSQGDVIRGKIQYQHTGGETGIRNIQDVITLLVSDKSVPSNPNLPVKDVIINITPTDNKPPRIVFGNPFFVDEGGKTTFTLDVLSAVDRDSTSDRIRFVITRQPEWGFVENILPSPGFEKSNAGKPISFFTFQDIADGNVNYVQSRFEGLEPSGDSLMLYVTDGEHSSPNVTFMININPQNDEAPTLFVRNFTVYEGSFFKIRTDTITANDLDIPMDMLMFSIIRAPEHGIIINRVPPLPQSPRPVFDFNLNQLLNTLSLAYVHDGSESTSDKFVVRVTDGKHSIRKMINITIIPVNDEAPVIIKNAGIKISIRESRLISPVILRSEDEDTPDDHLIYTLNSLPRRGTLQRKVNDDTWEDITAVLTNFTQEDLNQNLIRYLHSAALGSKGIDRFHFSVSDGVRSTGKQNFRIRIENTKREPLVITNNGLQLEEGQVVVIPPTLLSANDNSGELADIVFRVLSSPTQGHLEDIARPNIPLTSFTQMDVLGRRIIYRHLRTDRVQNDQFTFSITNGYELRNDTFHIVVIPVDDQLPILMVNEPLTVAQNGFQIVSLSQLQAMDPDTDSSSISFVITQAPQFGTLLIGGLPVERSFTQRDIENYDVSYRHDFGQAERDEFFFVVDDGTNTGFVVNGVSRYEPVSFRIQVNVVDRDPPEVLMNVGPTKMQTILDQMGFIFSNMNLHAVDECPPDGISYSLTKDPMFGHLEYVGSRERIMGQFSQSDVDNKRVMYVMRENVKAANDSFIFDVWDCHGNSLRNQRFSMHWAVVMFSRPQYMVCETDGTLPIHVIRVGNQLLSSFVTVEVEDMTARAGQDYIPSRARLLQMDPTISTATWNVQLLPDELEETRERFRVTLVDPVNAVLGQYSRVTVVIKDAKNGVCKGTSIPNTREETPGCCVDQPDMAGGHHVPMPDLPPSQPGGSAPGAGTSINPGPLDPLNPGPGPVDPQNPGPGNPFVPGVFDPNFDADGLIGGDPAVNDGPPIHIEGLPVVEHQSFDPYAAETWYQYPYGVGYDGTDGTQQGGRGPYPGNPGDPYVSQGVMVDPLPGQTCCEDTVLASIPGQTCCEQLLIPLDEDGLPVLDANPNQPLQNPDPAQYDSSNPFGFQQGNPYPPGRPASASNPQQPVPDTPFGQVYVPRNPGSSPSQAGEDSNPDGHVGTEDVRLYHATVGGVVPVVVSRPGEVDENRPPQTDVANVFVPSVVRGVQRQNGPPSGGGSSGRDPLRQIPLGQGNTQDGPRQQAPPIASSLVPFPCTPSNVGEIRQDTHNGLIIKCDGSNWVPFDLAELIRGASVYDDGQCERGWSYHNSRCFLISRQPQTWNEAQRICRERYNSNLASILSKRELKWLGDLLNGEVAWIGLNDKQTEETWEWVSGDPITFTRWSQSSRISNHASRYDCTYMTARLRWMDRDCDATTRSFVCMKNAM